jgi:hypothetical protein
MHYARERGLPMKVIAYDEFKPGVTMETIQPKLAEEVAHAWRLWKQGVVRENYSRVDEPGVVLVLEVENQAAAKRLLDEFPMSKAGFIEWHCIPVTVPFPLEAMFNDKALERVKMRDAELEWAKGQAPQQR